MERRRGPEFGMRDALRAWWPLALSWLLMSVELPAIGVVLARLEDPEINLAAYGGVVFPIALLVEAPIIMLLAASTALCRDAVSYRSLRRFMHRTSALLTVLHLLIAVTPLHGLVVSSWMGVPDELLPYSRVGLIIMLPWTWSIASRRFNQGVLIRYGRARFVTIGTSLRLMGDVTVLCLGWWWGDIWGVIVATTAVSMGVVVEAIFIAWAVRSTVRQHLSKEDPEVTHLRGRSFATFYVPLALTSVVTLLAQPLCAAALARMPGALESLAVWPILTGLLFMLQAMGMAYTEVVVSLVDRPGAGRVLKRFARWLAIATGSTVLLLAGTSLGELWFLRLTGLDAQLAAIGAAALWWAAPIPAMRALQSWYQGVLVQARKTAPVTESVLIFIAVCASGLWIGVLGGAEQGLVVAIIAFSVARMVQTLWLWWRTGSLGNRLV